MLIRRGTRLRRAPASKHAACRDKTPVTPFRLLVRLGNPQGTGWVKPLAGVLQFAKNGMPRNQAEAENKGLEGYWASKEILPIAALRASRLKW